MKQHLMTMAFCEFLAIYASVLAYMFSPENQRDIFDAFVFMNCIFIPIGFWLIWDSKKQTVMKTNREQLIEDLTDIYIDLVKDKESLVNRVAGASEKVDLSKLSVDHLKRNVALRIDSILRDNSF